MILYGTYLVSMSILCPLPSVVIKPIAENCHLAFALFNHGTNILGKYLAKKSIGIYKAIPVILCLYLNCFKSSLFKRSCITSSKIKPAKSYSKGKCIYALVNEVIRDMG